MCLTDYVVSYIMNVFLNFEAIPMERKKNSLRPRVGKETEK